MPHLRPYTALLALFGFIFPHVSVYASDSAPVTNSYGPLLLTVTSKTVVGTFFDGRGEPGVSGVPAFTCIFMLSGQIEGSSAQIVTWTPGDKALIPGELVLGNGEASITLRDNQAGCEMAGDDMVSAPWTGSFIKTNPSWIGVGMVAADRAILRPIPADSTRQGPYLIRFDPVVILERQMEWVKVGYLAGERTMKGWLRRSELMLVDHPPGSRISSGRAH